MGQKVLQSDVYGIMNWNRERADQTEGMMEEYDYKDTSKTLHLNFRGKIRENNMDNVDDELCSLHLYKVLLFW